MPFHIAAARAVRTAECSVFSAHGMAHCPGRPDTVDLPDSLYLFSGHGSTL